MLTRYILSCILLAALLFALPAAAQSPIQRLTDRIGGSAPAAGDAGADSAGELMLDAWGQSALDLGVYAAGPMRQGTVFAAKERGFGMSLEGFARRNGLSLLDAELAAQVWLLYRYQDQIWDPEANGGEGDWLDEARITYTRDDQGQTLELLYDEWDVEAEEWIPAVRQTWQRDEQGRILVALDESWDPEANGGEGDWAPLQRRSNTYNDQGNVLTSTTEFWDEDAGDYFIYIRRTMTYDSSGEVLLQELSESGLFGPLQPSFRYTYTYESGNLTEIFTENYSSSTEEWNEYRLETRAYDGNAEITERTFHDWDEGAGDWVNRDRTLTTYTPDSVAPTEVETIDQMWDPEADGGSGAWVNEQRDVSSYDAAARTATDLEQVWDPAANDGAGDWLNVERMTAEYSPSGQLESFLYEEWNAEASAWENTERGSAEFDENGLTIVQLTEAWDGGMWVNERRSLLSYEEFDATASEKEQPAELFLLGGNYPNPFRENTTIRYALAAPGACAAGGV